MPLYWLLIILKKTLSNNNIYYAHLDGLRGIAVLLVVAFHCNIQIFKGGFIGVDVFFVISGFLITRQIMHYEDFKVMHLFDFYSKRAARLFPSLFLTLTLVFVYGLVYLNPSDFDNLGKEIFFASFAILNFLYAEGIDYFASTEVKPLGHLCH